ncbi:MAG: 2-C-methyl-D-erythritol 4-phosphate cytidylyltransferase, partial [Deltaproteobacteria bacterium]|nr:2-C-methyl-D-erythritol 4-phosphate cytidylyltransferase [Deltaproteobacteria bacterium]
IQAIIPSAGQGRRFGALKQFLSLGERPILLYALEVFSSCPLIQGIGLVVPEAEIEKTRGLLGSSFGGKIKMIAGGSTRQESVARGFFAAEPSDLIIVHDGVRPFVSPSLIERVIITAEKFGASVPGLPVRETTKEVSDDNFVAKTVDRSQLWSIQTPQAFHYTILKKAIERARQDHFTGTDESMLVERIGVRVKVVEGDPENIKITRPEDLRMARRILNDRRSGA